MTQGTITHEELLKKSAALIRSLSDQLEGLKRDNATLLRQQHATELTGKMVESGILESKDTRAKVAELVKCSEEEFKTTAKAVSMLSEVPSLGILEDTSADLVDDSKDAITRVLVAKAMGEQI